MYTNSEIYMNQIIHALNFILFAGLIFVAFMILEWRIAVWRCKGDVYDFSDVLVNIGTSVLYKVTDGLFLALVIATFFEDIRALGLMYKADAVWLEWVMAFFWVDFLFYVMHLIMHKTRYAWAVHVTHHSSSRFNLSTALRQNFLLDLAGICLIIWIPLALIGFDMLTILVLIEMNLFYQFFLHTQLVEKLPKFIEYIFNTPSHHRVHHGCGEKQIDKNFGGVFIVWDRLFGTFQDEDDADEILYGIIGGCPKSLNPIIWNTHEWNAMWHDVYVTKNPSVLWRSPGYSIDKNTAAQLAKQEK